MAEIMTKFINDPQHITQELLEGYVLAYPDQVKLAAENIVVRTHPKSEDKVAIVTLGGSGHEPALSGFVGEGMPERFGSKSPLPTVGRMRVKASETP